MQPQSEGCCKGTYLVIQSLEVAMDVKDAFTCHKGILTVF